MKGWMGVQEPSAAGGGAGGRSDPGLGAPAPLGHAPSPGTGAPSGTAFLAPTSNGGVWFWGFLSRFSSPRPTV